jgi:sigma-B regulation protein RsbU (phosphoserine phosphatase)
MCSRTSTGSSDILDSVLDSVPVGVVVSDLEGRFLVFNREAEKILGIGAQTVGPEEWSRVYGCYLPDTVTPFPPDQLPLFRALRGEVVADQLIYITNPQQPQGLWITVSGRPWRDEEGTIRGGVIVIRDITERRNAGRETQFKEQLLAALDQTADSVVITDIQGKIIYVNPAFETMTGYSAADALGRSPAILKSGIQDDAFYRSLWDTITSGHSFQGTLVNKKKTGELFWTQQTITPMRDEKAEITHFVSVWKDITELLRHQEKEVEMRLARSIQQEFFSAPPSVPGFDIGRYSQTVHETGGDYCDFFPMASDRLGMVIADVSGHGMSAALIQAELRAYLRAFAIDHSDPGIIITLLNRALIPELYKGRFATMLLVCLDMRSRSLTYANAGHIPGRVLDAAGRVEYELEGTGPPLGTVSDFEYSTGRIDSLEDDQILMLLTDGIVEAIAVEDLDLGTARAAEYVAKNADQGAADISEGLCQAALRQAVSQTYVDDMTSIIVKIGHGS